MWIILLVVVLVIAFLYLNNKGNEINQTIREGGMIKKYSVIVNSILSEDVRAQVTHVSGDQIHITLLSSGGKTLFILIHNNNHLTIKWKVASPVFGSHEKKWTFPSDLDQNIIMEKVLTDLESYQSSLL